VANLAPVLEDLKGPEDDFYELDEDLYEIEEGPGVPAETVPAAEAPGEEGADAAVTK
jgi:hypothetical protein